MLAADALEPARAGRRLRAALHVAHVLFQAALREHPLTMRALRISWTLPWGHVLLQLCGELSSAIPAGVAGPGMPPCKHIR